MHTTRPTGAEPDESGDSLESVMADYLQRLESGQSPDPGNYINSYPQYADELQTFFRNHHWLGETPAPSCSPLLGVKIGPYQIEGEIARGGMGVVYRARQQGLERPVALKLITNGVLAGDEERRRFRIEAEAAARLHHPGIIAIHDIGSWQGQEYFSMTLVDGPTLQRQVDEGVTDGGHTARLVRDIARAVGYAHRAGIVHRDLKPENILISDDGRPLVTDFGLAKWHRGDETMITRTGQVLGTPHYMSPEQACGVGDATAAADIYSIGAILYALLTGRPPHEGSSPAEVLRSVLQDEPESPRQVRRDVPVDLEKICLKSMQYEPSLRYESADALADDLNRYLEGEPIVAAGSGLLDRMAREIRRDQHQTHFEKWGRTLVRIGLIVFLSHILMFLLDLAGIPRWQSFWIPRAAMLAAVFVVIYRAREGLVLPRSVAERPVWSIWLGYLLTLGVMNTLSAMDGIQHSSVFPIASALSGFGFLAMAGHVWGGSALFGLAFYIVAILTTLYVTAAPLIFGAMWLVALLALASHYRKKA